MPFKFNHHRGMKHFGKHMDHETAIPHSMRQAFGSAMSPTGYLSQMIMEYDNDALKSKVEKTGIVTRSKVAKTGFKSHTNGPARKFLMKCQYSDLDYAEDLYRLRMRAKREALRQRKKEKLENAVKKYGGGYCLGCNIRFTYNEECPMCGNPAKGNPEPDTVYEEEDSSDEDAAVVDYAERAGVCLDCCKETLLCDCAPAPQKEDFIPPPPAEPAPVVEPEEEKSFYQRWAESDRLFPTPGLTVTMSDLKKRPSPPPGTGWVIPSEEDENEIVGYEPDGESVTRSRLRYMAPEASRTVTPREPKESKRAPDRFDNVIIGKDEKGQDIVECTYKYSNPTAIKKVIVTHPLLERKNAFSEHQGCQVYMCGHPTRPDDGECGNTPAFPGGLGGRVCQSHWREFGVRDWPLPFAKDDEGKTVLPAPIPPRRKCTYCPKCRTINDSWRYPCKICGDEGTKTYRDELAQVSTAKGNRVGGFQVGGGVTKVCQGCNKWRFTRRVDDEMKEERLCYMCRFQQGKTNLMF